MRARARERERERERRNSIQLMDFPPVAPRYPSTAPSTTGHVDSNTFNSRIMVAAMVILFVVVVFVVSLHVYAKWFWRHGTAASRWPTTHALNATWHRRRRSALELLTDESMVANTCAGLDPSVVNSLPTFIYQGATLEAEPLLECAVCLSEFQVDDSGRTLPNCKHSFHIDCIDTWFLSRSTCPLCRTPVVSTPTHGEQAENTSSHPPPSLQHTVSSTMHSRHADEQNASAVQSIGRPMLRLQDAVTAAVPREPLPLLQSTVGLDLHLQQEEGIIATKAGVVRPLHLPSHSASASCTYIPSHGEFIGNDVTAQTSMPQMGGSGPSSARAMSTEMLRQQERAAIARSTSLGLSRQLTEELQECPRQPQKSSSFRISIKRLVSRELSKGRSRVFPSGQVNAELAQSATDMNLPV